MTNRRPFSRQPLGVRERIALEASVGAGYRVLRLEGKETLRKMVRLLFDNAEIRLTMPEAYPVHKTIIEWDAQFSRDRIPDQAVGLDPVALKLMRWVMASWERQLTPKQVWEMVERLLGDASYRQAAGQWRGILRDWDTGQVFAERIAMQNGKRQKTTETQP